MSTISPINSAYRQNLAFRSNENSTEGAEKPKRHPFKAAASVILPGSGEILNGDFAKGALHLGAFFGIRALAKRLIVKNRPQFEKNLKLYNRFLNDRFFDKKLAADGFKGVAKAVLSPKVMSIFYKGLSKTTIAGSLILSALCAANIITSAKSAYKGKEA